MHDTQVDITAFQFTHRKYYPSGKPLKCQLPVIFHSVRQVMYHEP